jgi:hypothetical protein
MRLVFAFASMSIALLLVWGCGGKVFVDGQAAGAGGSITGTTESSGDTSSTSSGSGITCDLLCGGPVGLCGCSGSCSDGKMRAVGCSGSAASGFQCTCNVDGQTVGTCTDTGLICGLPESCCAKVFGL